MTIKQYGGVFGRNPTFNEVSAESVDIDGGSIDGVTIATSDITVGAGKTLNVSGGTLTLANDQISGDSIQGGLIGSIGITVLDLTGSNVITRSASGVSVAAGILSNDAIGFAPMAGILHISETGSTRYIITSFHKSAQASGLQFTTIGSDTLTIASSNTLGTVVCGNFTTAANLQWHAIVYDLSP